MTLFEAKMHIDACSCDDELRCVYDTARYAIQQRHEIVDAFVKHCIQRSQELRGEYCEVTL